MPPCCLAVQVRVVSARAVASGLLKMQEAEDEELSEEQESGRVVDETSPAVPSFPAVKDSVDTILSPLLIVFVHWPFV